MSTSKTIWLSLPPKHSNLIPIDRHLLTCECFTDDFMAQPPTHKLYPHLFLLGRQLDCLYGHVHKCWRVNLRNIQHGVQYKTRSRFMSVNRVELTHVSGKFVIHPSPIHLIMPSLCSLQILNFLVDLYKLSMPPSFCCDELLTD